MQWAYWGWVTTCLLICCFLQWTKVCCFDIRIRTLPVLLTPLFITDKDGKISLCEFFMAMRVLLGDDEEEKVGKGKRVNCFFDLTYIFCLD